MVVSTDDKVVVVASVSKLFVVVSLFIKDDNVVFITIIVSLLTFEIELFDVEPNVQTTKATPNSIESFRIIFVILEIFFTPRMYTQNCLEEF